MFQAVVSSARLVSLPVVALLALLACGDGSGSSDDAAELPLGLDAAVACPDWTHELSSGENGLLADIEGDGEVTARILDASNVPPRKGFNTWTIELQGTDGERRDDYQITWICSFMPDHNHTAGPQVSAGDEPGQFLIDRLNLGMNGGWEIPLWVDPVDAGKPAYTRVSVDDFCKPVGEASRSPDMVFRTCVPRR
jgi:hypothetical protein